MVVVGWWRFLSEPAPLRSAVWKGVLGILLALHGPPAFKGRVWRGRVAARKKESAREEGGGGGGLRINGRVGGGREKKKPKIHNVRLGPGEKQPEPEPEPDLNLNLNHGRRTGLIEGDGRGAAVRECDLAGTGQKIAFWLLAAPAGSRLLLGYRSGWPLLCMGAGSRATYAARLGWMAGWLPTSWRPLDTGL